MPFVKNKQKLCAFFVTGILLLIAPLSLWSSSHSDAPLIKQDPQANLTDVYAFIGTKYNDPTVKVLNVFVHVRPFSEPGDGVMYDRFADDALYSIHITHPATGEELMRYNFAFSAVNPATAPGLKNPNTILSYGLGTEVGPIVTIGDARQNFTQTYIVEKVVGKSRQTSPSLLTAPPNVGLRTTPAYNDPTTGQAVSGAATFAALDSYTQQAVFNIFSTEVAFAGPREDGFYADTPGIFDLLDPRIVDNDSDPTDGIGQDGNGVDGFKGFNVLAYGLQIPVSSLQSFDFVSPFFGTCNGVGVYASVSRPKKRIFKKDGTRENSDKFVEVNRLANPLFNEVLVALQDKDLYNRTEPTDDAQFSTYAENPEIAALLNFVFGLTIPTAGRVDLAAIYIPDVIRVDTTTAPVRLAGDAGFNRLGFIGGDTTDGKSGGWPNGRRFGDDVVDIALTAVASGPTYSTIIVVGDNVPANDQLYNGVFPYSGTPNSGAKHSKDSGANDQ